MRIADGFEKESEGALQLLDDSFSKRSEFDVWMFVVEEFSELGNTLSVCLRLKAEALGFQKSSQFLVVGNDTVVDNRELRLWVGPIRIPSAIFSRHDEFDILVVPVRMTVQTRRRTMGRPSSMGNTSVRVKNLGHVHIGLGNQLLQFGNLSDLFKGIDLILLVPVHRKTSGVIPTVFKTREA